MKFHCHLTWNSQVTRGAILPPSLFRLAKSPVQIALGRIFGSTQRRTFRNVLQWAWNLPGLRELAWYRINAFPGKVKDVLHSQEDGTSIFPSQLHNMSELCAFIRNIHNFSKFSKIVQSSEKNFSASRR